VQATRRNERKPVAAFIHNPIKIELEALREFVDRTAEEAGWGPTMWFETTEDDPGQEVTASALRRGASVVLAAGGDGTVRAVAEGLRGSGVPLALLASGTGNLYARNLELPLNDVQAMITAAFTGDDRVVDLGVARIERVDGTVSEHAFCVMAGLGLDAKMIKNTNTKLKKAVGWLAYVDGIARSVPELRPLRLRYSVDDGPERAMTAHTIIVGNCGALPGGFLLMPEARPDDGILDIAALRPRGPLGWAKVWRKVAWENGVLRKSAVGRRIIDLSKDVRDVVNFRAREIRMQLETPDMFQLDGDEYGVASSVHAWVDPGSLVLKVPALAP
jgi:diacylglycerol kinase family enzyme